MIGPQQVPVMPQYDDSFLYDCEKKRNARSYKPCTQFAIRNGNDFVKSQQENAAINKWKKKYFTLKRNASQLPSTSIPIYRSMYSLVDNGTNNCKFKMRRQFYLICFSVCTHLWQYVFTADYGYAGQCGFNSEYDASNRIQI